MKSKKKRTNLVSFLHFLNNKIILRKSNDTSSNKMKKYEISHNNPAQINALAKEMQLKLINVSVNHSSK